MIVANSGTAPLEDVKLAGTAPTGWEVSFDPQQRSPTVQPNETAQVTAIIKPAKDAVAGDYMITVRSSAGSESSNLDLLHARGLAHARLRGDRRDRRRPSLVLAGVFVKFGGGDDDVELARSDRAAGRGRRSSQTERG